MYICEDCLCYCDVVGCPEITGARLAVNISMTRIRDSLGWNVLFMIDLCQATKPDPASSLHYFSSYTSYTSSQASDREPCVLFSSKDKST